MRIRLAIALVVSIGVIAALAVGAAARGAATTTETGSRRGWSATTRWELVRAMRSYATYATSTRRGSPAARFAARSAATDGAATTATTTSS
jgi:hypothetical protein